ncbi:hypothetical protein AMK59_5561 [Oryctes borbonicus]|uniref:Eukaryotic translation initiation factor 4 gamma 2 n=1 Tax=Oryctes borbonicus TaxID=1629725 RepID=A0A0T6B2H5_9SCAR|nr:hypothetical protein AMK59_5561 [Oryctes borbonicus]
MYAQLCKRLSEEAPNFEPPNSPCTFRVLLLNKCKNEFENRAATFKKYGYGDNTLEEEERRQLAKRKMLGNIKFIGELGKLEILAEGILHRCIQELLITRKGDDPSEDLECLCQILRTCGRILDTNKGKKLMDQYFERMALLADNTDLAPRIRFMLKDVIDLRQDGWMPRKATVVEGPMPIHQIRPTEDDRPGYRRDRNPDRETERSSSHDLFRHPMKTRGGLEDMMFNINLPPTGPNLISTFNGFGGGAGQREGSFRGHNNQRSGFNNYNNQRGQYKHNQNNTNTQYNNQSNKELAPRFKKNLLSQNIGDVELRPAPNSLSNKAVKTNNIMNSKPIEPLSATPKQTSTALLKESLPIKQVSTDKPKQTKKDKGPNKEEVMKKYFALIDDYLKGDITLQEAVDIYRDNKVPDKFLKDTITNSLKQSLDKADEDREKYVTFFTSLRKENLITNGVIHETFKLLCNVLEERENEITKVMEASSVLFSSAVSRELVTLSDIANLTDNGVHYPLFLLVLQRLHKTMGKTELIQVFNNSRINLLSHLPENDRTKERLTEILEEKDLTFLYPLLRIQAELSKQLQVDPNPQVFYKWIKENLDSVNYTDPGFINALMTVLLKYITQEAVLVADGDDKGIAERERSMLERYLPILQAFLHEQPTLQLVAVYSLQVHFYSQGFPRGQLLRWFMALYDLEIVEEEAFLNWKEDVTDAYPGKGQALFQVNQWLTWLQEAESEEEEEGDE